MNTLTPREHTKIQSPPTRQSNKPAVWLWRGFWGLLALIGILPVAGALFQAIATQIDQRNYPPSGQLVDVGGYKLHITCIGEGSPTVILDHVGAGNSAQWGLVQPAMAQETRMCAYDRAGFGWSEAGPSPRDVQQNVHELHTLLTNANIPGPYVLVGHSHGGNVAQLYAATYPDEVAGLVLVDPGMMSDPADVALDGEESQQSQDQIIMKWAPILSRLGVMRLAALIGAIPGHGDLPAPFGAAFDVLNLTTKFWDTVAAQNEAMPATSVEILGISAPYDAGPLIVLSAEQPQDDPSRQAWTSHNAELAAQATDGVHRLVVGSDHMSLALKQDHAQQTSAAILQIVEAVRTRTERSEPIDK